MIAKTLCAFIAGAMICSAAEKPVDLASAIAPLRDKYKVPACGVAVIDRNGIVGIGVTGKRRSDRDFPATTEDIWHIGSCTKAMTAALIGMLVDEGKLRWDMPVTEALPDISANAGWRTVTIEHFVTQRSGIAGMTRGQWRTIDAGGGSPRDQRFAFAKQMLSQPPERPPGKFEYSNAGYGIVGAIIEQTANRSYEDLMKERIFAPLKLASAGFGPPGVTGERVPSQPWGHYRRDDLLTPVVPSPDNHFPPAIAPGACVHMSLRDFAKFAWWVSSNEPALVKPQTFRRLQAPPEGSTYAGGLWLTELPGIGGAAVSHSGHMSGFFGVFHSGKERACVSVFNTEGGGWEWLGDEIASAALKALK